MKDSEQLRQAAAVIRERGWRRGSGGCCFLSNATVSYNHADGSYTTTYGLTAVVEGVCVLEALGLVQGCDWRDVRVPPALLRAALTERARLGFLAERGDAPYVTVYRANDAPGQTEAGVLTMLAAAAFLAELELSVTKFSLLIHSGRSTVAKKACDLHVMEVT